MNYVLRCCKSSRLLKPKLIVLCLMSLFAIECQSSILKNDTNKKQEVYSKLENAVKAKLNNPESVKFYNVKKIQDDSDDRDTIIYCGKVKEKVPAGGYNEKERFIYSVERDEAYFIPNEKPDDEEEELIYSVIWKGKCIKNNYEFVNNKSMDLSTAMTELEDAKEELEKLEDLENAKDERDMLKITENSPEYLKAKEKYESLKKRVDQLTEELENVKEKLEDARDERDMLKSFENSPEYLNAKKKYKSLRKRVDQLDKELTIYN